jgi:uncharacterized protein (TIGR03435 family)
MAARTHVFACLIAFVSWPGFGQDRDLAATFEVASLKPSGPNSVRGSEGGPLSPDPGRYSFNSASLRDLIVVAYNVRVFQISSSIPLDRETFDLAAKVPLGATKEQFRVMLQNLLAERFHLKLHVQSKEFPAYQLVVAKGGPKLTEPGASATRPDRRDGFPEVAPDRPGIASTRAPAGGFELIRLRAHQEPVGMLAQMLVSPDALPTAPSLFTALQQQLGLQLVSRKVPFDVLVIDHVDRTPSEN